MKILHAVGDDHIIPYYHSKTGEKMNVLISYVYLPGNAHKLIVEYRPMIGCLYLDSGAFSAETKNTKISLPEFRAYIRRYGDRFDEIFTLDDDFHNPDHNFNNQVYLEEGISGNAKRPIPVIHDQDDPFGEFEMYVEQGHDYIAIGSNQRARNDLFEQAQLKYPDVKIHAFGTLNRKMLTTYRPYSADATTWAITGSKGNIFYWDPKECKEHKIDVGEKEKKDRSIVHFNNFELKDDLNQFLSEKFGYSRHDLLSAYDPKRVVNIYFLKQLEDHINSLAA